MKRLLRVVVILLAILAIVTFALLRFIRPDRQLDLSYAGISIADKAAQLLLDRKPELVLTEQDVNTLLKSELSRHSQLRPDLAITGADFRLEGNRIVADVNVLWKDRVPAGLTAVYKLSWKSPELIAEFDHAEIKGRTLPAGWLHPGDLRFNLEEQLPPYVSISRLDFPGDEVRVRFQLQSPLR